MNDLEEQAREYLIRNFGEPMPGSIITPKQAPELMADFARTIFPDYERLKSEKPIDMILHCPYCSKQHIDKAEPEVCENCGHPEVAHMRTGCWIGKKCECVGFTAWLNPPHRKHRCHYCNRTWKPALIATNGVEALNRTGKGDADQESITEVKNEL